MEKLTGIHAVREALAAGRPLQTVIVGRGHHGGRLSEIVQLAKSRGIPVRFEDRVQLDRGRGNPRPPGRGGAGGHRRRNFAGRAAGAPPRRQRAPACSFCSTASKIPQNLGAIVQTALAAGAEGAVIPERRSAGLTEAAARASAGAVAHLPVARVGQSGARHGGNENGIGYWLVGLDERADRRHSDVDLTGPVGLVLGGEGKGLHALVKERCDFLVSIPTTGPVLSLNVSVAAGIALFEAVRQRAAKAHGQESGAKHKAHETER